MTRQSDIDFLRATAQSLRALGKGRMNTLQQLATARELEEIANRLDDEPESVVELELRGKVS